jgi:hypothetical protein
MDLTGNGLPFSFDRAMTVTVGADPRGRVTSAHQSKSESPLLALIGGGALAIPAREITFYGADGSRARRRRHSERSVNLQTGAIE